MLFDLLSLLASTSMMALGIIGAVTVVNKTGNFIKTMEEEKTDAYKKAFDKFMVQSIDEINFSIDSIGLITKHTVKNSKLLFDIVSGNKSIKKDKDGKIIVSDKSKINEEEYKEKIEHLYAKMKKYQNEIKKIKDEKEENNKKKTNDKEEDDDESSSSGSEEEDELEYYMESEK